MKNNFDSGNEHALILFDGVCNFCNAAVKFIIKRDKKGYFQYAPLQSPLADKIFNNHGLQPGQLDTVTLVENGKLYTRSEAALRIARRLSFPWPLTYAFIIVPKFIRDGLYNIIGHYRYKWFGKLDSCMVPEPGWQERFVDAQR